MRAAADHILLMTVSYKPSSVYEHYKYAAQSILSFCGVCSARSNTVGHTAILQDTKKTLG